MSTSQHIVSTTTNTNTNTNTHTYDKNGAHGTNTHHAHDKTHTQHNNEHVKDEFAGSRGTTSSADNLRNDPLVKTGGYTTGLEAASGIGQPAGHAAPMTTYNQGAMAGGMGVTNVPTSGAQIQNTVPNAANRDGLVVNDGIGGARGGAAILGAQCECTMNGGNCSHGAGQCACRGYTTKATTINPGINVGVSTTQYTAPATTTGIGGGVAEFGTGIAGLVHTNNAATRPVDAAHHDCECVKKNGSCGCAPGQCTCTHCTASRAAQAAATKAHNEKDKHTGHHTGDKDHGHQGATSHGHHHGATAAATGAAATGALSGAHMQTTNKNVDGPGVSNVTMSSSNMTATHPYANPSASTSVGSTNAYSANNYTEGKPVGNMSSSTSNQANNMAHSGRPM